MGRRRAVSRLTAGGRAAIRRAVVSRNPGSLRRRAAGSALSFGTPALTTPEGDVTDSARDPLPQQDSLLGCLVRITWMGGGLAVIFLSAVRIAEKRPLFGVSADIALWLAALAAIAVRFVDVRFLAGQTAAGQPATLAHWRRYALVLVATAAAVWAAARLLARTGILP